MISKHSIIVAGVLACASLHINAGLFDSVSDLTGGIIKIEERKPEDAPAVHAEETSTGGREHSKKTKQRRALGHERQMTAQDAEAEKDRGDVLYRNFNISEKRKKIDKLTSIAISLGAESNEGRDKFMSSIPKEPQGDYSNGGRMKPDEVEKWIAETGPVIESRILDLKSRLELNNDGRAFLEKIQRAEGRNDNNTPFPVFSWKGEEGTSASIKLGMTPFEIFRELKNMESAGVLSKIDMPRKALIKADRNAYGDKLSLEFDYVPVSEKGPEVLAMAILKFDRLEYMPPMEPVKEKYRKLLPNAIEGSFFLPTGETYLDEEGMRKDGSWERLQELHRKSQLSQLQWQKENTEAAFRKSLIETKKIENEVAEIQKAHTIQKKRECPMLSGAGYAVIFIWQKNRPVVEQIAFVDRKLQEATKEISDRKKTAAAAAAKAEAEAAAKARLESQLDF